MGNLRLEHASRKYLEAHNVAPIDLAPLVKHLAPKDQHTAAMRIFFDEMRKGKPAPANEWKQTPSTEFPLLAMGTDFYQRVGKDHALAAELLMWTTHVSESQGFPIA